MTTFELHKGDTLEALKALPDDSVDSIVTDPPYGLSKPPNMAEVLKHWLNGDDYEHTGKGFMGKSWDSFVPGPAVWRECLRVLKPGGHMVTFGGTRTYDILVLAIRLGGFEIRDQLAWVYGSGFPKSLNVEKATGNDKWEGWGTALKPAFEPIVLARKPLDGTVASNVGQHGTGGLNIAACRVGGEVVTTHDRGLNGAFPKRPGEVTAEESGRDKDQRYGIDRSDRAGRFPANLIHDGSEDVIQHFPSTKSGSKNVKKKTAKENEGNTGAAYGKESRAEGTEMISYGDQGSAARFFYCAKATKKDRNEGMDHFDETQPEELVGRKEGSAGINNPRAGAGRTSGSKNNHPTVKPTALMQWLVRLVTPFGGTVLDTYTGSGSTGKAAALEGFNFIGIDKDEDEKGNDLGYLKIARARIEAAGGRELVEFEYEELVGTFDPIEDLI